MYSNTIQFINYAVFMIDCLRQVTLLLTQPYLERSARFEELTRQIRDYNHRMSGQPRSVCMCVSVCVCTFSNNHLTVHAMGLLQHSHTVQEFLLATTAFCVRMRTSN